MSQIKITYYIFNDLILLIIIIIPQLRILPGAKKKNLINNFLFVLITRIIYWRNN